MNYIYNSCHRKATQSVGGMLEALEKRKHDLNVGCNVWHIYIRLALCQHNNSIAFVPVPLIAAGGCKMEEAAWLQGRHKSSRNADL